jgi:hypothetical protein
MEAQSINMLKFLHQRMEFTHFCDLYLLLIEPPLIIKYMFCIHFEQIWVFSEKSAWFRWWAAADQRNIAFVLVLNYTKSPTIRFYTAITTVEDSILFCRWEYLDPRIEATTRCFQYFCGNNLFETIVVFTISVWYHKKNIQCFEKLWKKVYLRGTLVRAQSQDFKAVDQKSQRYYLFSDCLLWKSQIWRSYKCWKMKTWFKR